MAADVAFSLTLRDILALVVRPLSPAYAKEKLCDAFAEMDLKGDQRDSGLAEPACQLSDFPLVQQELPFPRACPAARLLRFSGPHTHPSG